jgi:cbb3-type cytochrome c oxidase subunit I
MLRRRAPPIRAKEGEGLAIATITPRSSLVDFLAPRETDSAARRHLIAALVFLLVAGFFTLLMFVKMAYPNFLSGQAFTTYGPLRPITISTTVLGFLTLMHLAAIYYLVPRLTGARLWNERVANLGLWLAIGVNVAAVVSLAAGFSDGREWLEIPWWLDIAAIAMLAVPTLVVTLTMRSRTEEGLFVSLWYFLAGLYWVIALFVVGSIPNLYGAAAQIQSSFFVSGVIELWLVGIGIGIAYYLVPKITDNPLFNRQLALIGFWSLAFAGAWVGQSRFVYGPGPEWLKTTASVFSLALVVAAMAVVANLVGTMRGKWSMVRESAPLRFALIGALLYLVVAVLRLLQGFRSVAAIIGLTSFGDGTIVLTLFGLSSLWAAAFTYHALPRLIGRRVYSARITTIHLRATLVGVGLLAGLLWLAGLVSGYSWAAGALTGTYVAVGDGFVNTLDQVRLAYGLAALAALVLFGGQIAFAYNAYRTFTSGSPTAHEALVPGDPMETADE